MVNDSMEHENLIMIYIETTLYLSTVNAQHVDDSRAKFSQSSRKASAST